MDPIKRLPDAELAVMQLVWDGAPPITASQVQQRAAKDWKATSVLTFLSRLTAKGFLRCEREGRQNLYTPLISRDRYLQCESQRFVRGLCGGSVKKLVASLSDAGALSERDVAELRAYLDAMAGAQE